MGSEDLQPTWNEIAILLATTLPLVLLWAFIVWRRTYRLVRLFQLSRYNSQRFLRWLMRNRRERFYVLVNLIVLVLILAVITYFVGLLDEAYRIEQAGLGFVLLLFCAPALLGFDYILAILSLAFLPRNRRIQPEVPFASRTKRLAMTTVIVSVVAALGATVELIIRWEIVISPVSLFIHWMLIAGPIAVLFSPLALAFSNGIMWPIESLLRSRRG